jgi:hypothetical protein
MAQAVPIANVWKGINRRVAPSLISEQESPDSVNTDFKNGQVGVLAGRKGAAKLSDTAYTYPILSLLPAHFPGIDPPDRIIVVDNNGNVIDDPQPFGGGSPWGGPTIVINGGFYALCAINGAAPTPTNGATFAIANVCSITLDTVSYSSWTIDIWCTFAGVGEVKAARLQVVKSSSALAITTTNYLMNITGATAFTSCRAECSAGATFAGNIYIAGGRA